MQVKIGDIIYTKLDNDGNTVHIYGRVEQYNQYNKYWNIKILNYDNGYHFDRGSTIGLSKSFFANNYWRLASEWEKMLYLD